MAKLSDLTPITTMASDDIIHLKPAAGNDLKITWANLVKAMQKDMEPVGTIKYFDANNAGGGGDPTGISGAWVDDTTIPGWYACIAGNSDHGCPNLVDKFIMGKVVAGAAATGGANTMTDHIHSASTQSASHTHTTDIGSHSHVYKVLIAPGSGTGYPILTDQTDSPNVDMNTESTTIGNKSSGNQSADHTHTIGAGAVPGSTDNRPAYYSVVIIRKCA